MVDCSQIRLFMVRICTCLAMFGNTTIGERGFQLAAKPSAVRQQLSAELTCPAEPDLRRIISRNSEIPVGIQNAVFSYAGTRVLDQALLDELASQPASAPNWQARLDRRKSNLERHVGARLTCVFIRLPGVHYTIEIDAAKGTVVHWEWQQYV